MSNERITPNSTGGVDEVVRVDTTIHVEQMSPDAYWMSVGKDHFWFTVEGPPDKRRIELRHTHDDGFEKSSIECCCADGPSLEGRALPLEEEQCGHCHCYANQGTSEVEYCCWCRFHLSKGSPAGSSL